MRASDGPDVERPRDGEAYFDVGTEGVRIGLVEAETDVDYDLDHVALFSRDPEADGERVRLARLRPGCARRIGRRRGSRSAAPSSSSIRGDPGEPERPLLNHLAVLVESADESIAAANDLGVEIDDVVDAPNTYAVFLRGPERVRIEYVEHKPTFSLDVVDRRRRRAWRASCAPRAPASSGSRRG